jgi:cytochrome c-type biogenesis protein
MTGIIQDFSRNLYSLDDLILAYAEGLLSLKRPCFFPFFIGFFLIAVAASLLTKKKGHHDRWPAPLIPVPLLVFIISFVSGVVLWTSPFSTGGMGLWGMQKLMQWLAGSFVCLSGLALVGFPIRGFAWWSPRSPDSKSGQVPWGILTGLGTAAAYNPCPGWVLTSIIILSGFEKYQASSILLMGIYAFGLCFPLILGSVSVNIMVRILPESPVVLRWVLKLIGGLLVIWGVLAAAGWLPWLKPLGAQTGVVWIP